MKKWIALVLAAAIMLSVSGCSVDTDALASAAGSLVDEVVDDAKEQLSDALDDAIEDAKDQFSLDWGKEDSAESNENWPCRTYETSANSLYGYTVVTENNDRAVRIRRQDGEGNVYLIDRDMDFETFKQYAGGNTVYTDEELEIMLAIYKAQDIGVELLELLYNIQESQTQYQKAAEEGTPSAVRDYLKTMKCWLDTGFALVENAEETKAAAMSKEEFLELCFGENAPDVIDAGEDLEDAVEILRTAYSIYQFSQAYSADEPSQAQTEAATVLMLDIIDTVLDIAPDELLVSQVYSGQLEALKQSCQGYFDGCERYTNYLTFTDAFIEQRAVEDVLKASDTDPEWTMFMRVFNGGNVRSCWGDPCMPSLSEIKARLAQTNGTVTVYEQIGIDDALNGTNHQFWITKYIEFRIHFEFEELTGITLACYYDLMQPEKDFFGGISYKKAPWEKGIDPEDYSRYDPAM